jgi:ribonuclease HI
VVTAVYTDGSVLVNPDGPGGWAFVVVRDGDAREQVSGHNPKTTNNIMEMTAVIEAIKFLPEPERFVVISDSQYVVYGITKYMSRWKANGWRIKNGPRMGSSPANCELWELLDDIIDHTRMSFRWIRGHNRSHFNEIADELAGKEARRFA